MIVHIVAFARMEDGKLAIGVKDELPWNIPEDLRHFRDFTMGKTIYMGKNTFNSLLKRCKGKSILPGRSIVVISSIFESKYSHLSNVRFLTKENLDMEIAANPDNEFVIVGGSKLFDAYFPDIIVATEIFTKIDSADCFYPRNSFDNKILESEFTNYSKVKNIKYSIKIYRR